MATKRKAMPPKRATADRFPLIETALKKRTKVDLIAIVMRLAKKHDEMSRALEAELDVQKPADLLSEDVASAICRATNFDENMLNHNFEVDWQAYEDVKMGFEQLIRLGHLEDVKTLALKLMKDGSYQVECSDEGLMTDDIEDCLKPVLRAVKSSGDAAARKWALEMLLADRVGFICTNELKKMSGQS